MVHKTIANDPIAGEATRAFVILYACVYRLITLDWSVSNYATSGQLGAVLVGEQGEAATPMFVP